MLSRTCARLGCRGVTIQCSFDETRGEQDLHCPLRSHVFHLRRSARNQWLNEIRHVSEEAEDLGNFFGVAKYNRLTGRALPKQTHSRPLYPRDAGVLLRGVGDHGLRCDFLRAKEFSITPAHKVSIHITQNDISRGSNSPLPMRTEIGESIEVLASLLVFDSGLYAERETRVQRERIGLFLRGVAVRLCANLRVRGAGGGDRQCCDLLRACLRCCW